MIVEDDGHTQVAVVHERWDDIHSPVIAVHLRGNDIHSPVIAVHLRGNDIHSPVIDVHECGNGIHTPVIEVSAGDEQGSPTGATHARPRASRAPAGCRGEHRVSATTPWLDLRRSHTSSATISIAPQGHSAAHTPQPLQ
ncbi:MAG: hypothetical protein RIQ60_2382 [Pseudomonadota bacterium]|jgi:hypothetical protein